MQWNGTNNETIPLNNFYKLKKEKTMKSKTVQATLLSLTLIIAAMLIGCGTTPFSSYESNTSINPEEEKVAAASNYRVLCVTDLPGNPDDYSQILQTWKITYTHWSGKKFGLKILESGPNKFEHAPNNNWNRSFFSNRVDYISDGGGHYSATLVRGVIFQHRNRFTGRTHQDDRIHFLSTNGKKICVRLYQMFMHDGSNRDGVIHFHNHQDQDCAAFCIGNTWFVNNRETQQEYVGKTLYYSCPGRQDMTATLNGCIFTLKRVSDGHTQTTPTIHYDHWDFRDHYATLIN